MNPLKLQRVMTHIERVIYPKLDELEEQLNEPVDIILLLSLVHRAATRGVPKDQLLREVSAHYDTQVAHNHDPTRPR